MTQTSNSFSRFFRNLFIFTLIIGGIVYFLSFFLLKEHLSPALPFMILYFFASAIVFYLVFNKITAGSTSRFIRSYMLVSFTKLIFNILVLTIYIFLNRDDALPFSIAFMILYFLFMIFEVMAGLKKSR